MAQFERESGSVDEMAISLQASNDLTKTLLSDEVHDSDDGDSGKAGSNNGAIFGLSKTKSFVSSRADDPQADADNAKEEIASNRYDTIASSRADNKEEIASNRYDTIASSRADTKEEIASNRYDTIASSRADNSPRSRSPQNKVYNNTSPPKMTAADRQYTRGDKALEISREEYEKIKKNTQLAQRLKNGDSSEQVSYHYPGAVEGLQVFSYDEENRPKQNEATNKVNWRANSSNSVNKSVASSARENVTSTATQIDTEITKIEEESGFWAAVKDFLTCGPSASVADEDLGITEKKESEFSFHVHQGDGDSLRNKTKETENEKELVQPDARPMPTVREGEMLDLASVHSRDIIEACQRKGIPTPERYQMHAPGFNFPRYENEMLRVRANQEQAFAHRIYLKKGEIHYLPTKAEKRLREEKMERDRNMYFR